MHLLSVKKSKKQYIAQYILLHTIYRDYFVEQIWICRIDTYVRTLKAVIWLCILVAGECGGGGLYGRSPGVLTESPKVI